MRRGARVQQGDVCGIGGMRLIPPLVVGLWWHLVFVWTGAAAPWVSLLVLVLLVSVLAVAHSLVKATAWSWLRNTLSSASRFVRAAAAALGDDDPWDDVSPVASVAASAVGWFVVQVVDLATQDVVARVILLVSGLVLLALDVTSAKCREAQAAKRSAGTDAETRGLSASLPLPKPLGGGDKGGKLRFVLDV